MRGAPRRLLHFLQRCARGAMLSLGFLAGATGVALACSPIPGQASDPALGAYVVPPPCYRMGVVFDAPTERYPHGVLGDGIEYGALVAELEQSVARVDLPQDRVFEDIAPRMADVTGDGVPEVIVVESHASRGAALVVYAPRFGVLRRPALRRLAETVPIGQRFRWLAPAGIADFDGDGRIDIAYVDRPHLAKVLRFVTVEGDRLVEFASAPGFSNHRIGESFISGGVRECGAGPELVLADGAWRRIVAVRLEAGAVTVRDLGPLSMGFAAALGC